MPVEREGPRDGGGCAPGKKIFDKTRRFTEMKLVEKIRKAHGKFREIQERPHNFFFFLPRV